MRTIGVVHCARSDYGIYLPVVKKIKAHSELVLHNYVTGMHLAPEFGRTVDAFARDGFEVHDQIEMLLSSDTPAGIAKSMGLGTIGFAQVFSREQPDVLLLMGDRFEMLAAATASLPFNIPIAHMHGGEATEGLIDEAIRHSITKMSHLHFPSTDIYGQRIQQMGEEDWRITVSGAPGLDNIHDLPLLAKDETAAHFGFDPSRPVLLVTFHPVTLAYEDTLVQIDNLLSALAQIDAQKLFTYPNADTSGRVIIQKIEAFCANQDDARVVVNATQEGYFSLLSAVDVMVGNSSSGIIEAASFKCPVVNIGNRQQGRIHSYNVIDCEATVQDILQSITKTLTPDFRSSLTDLTNPYGDGTASVKIANRLAEVKLDRKLLIKRFVTHTV